MITVREYSWLPAKLLLLAVLTVAESGALAHAFKHDAATPQNPACAICVTVAQLGTSCIDALDTPELTIDRTGLVAIRQEIPVSLQFPIAKQRGPPFPH